ncbi:MAG: hypothetical protein MI749_01915 [Desulfovibrionales bacterium]|nr:hypothetical protein [Desulfovibrionales bacterium]
MAAGQAAYDAFISMHGSSLTTGPPDVAETSQAKPTRALGLCWKPLASELTSDAESSHAPSGSSLSWSDLSALQSLARPHKKEADGLKALEDHQASSGLKALEDEKDKGQNTTMAIEDVRGEMTVDAEVDMPEVAAESLLPGVAAESLQPEDAEPLQPEAAEPLQPAVAEPLQPGAAKQPEAAEPLQPEVAEPLQPEAAEPLQPEAAEPLQPEAADQLQPEGVDKEEPPLKKRKTFASRARPTVQPTLMKWESIKKIFEAHVKGNIKNPSKFEKQFWVRCMQVIDDLPDDMITPDSLDIVTKQEADDFLREQQADNDN